MTKKNKDINTLSYEQAQSELQELLGQIEAQSIPLDALLAAYQRCQELLAHCRGNIQERAACPVSIVPLDTMPLTPVGKIDKKLLRQTFDVQSPTKSSGE